MIALATAVHAAQGAGWTGDDIATAVAVAMASSALNETKTARQADGSIRYGLWQVPSTATEFGDAFTSGAWKDPNINAQMAHMLWSRGGWAVFPVTRRDNALGFATFTAALPAAKVAAAAVKTAVDPAIGAAKATGNAIQSVTGAASSLAGEGIAALRWFQQPQTWVRILKVGIGGALIVGGVVLLARGSITSTAANLGGKIIKGVAA